MLDILRSPIKVHPKMRQTPLAEDQYIKQTFMRHTIVPTADVKCEPAQ
jgi:hypothetical protein